MTVNTRMRTQQIINLKGRQIEDGFIYLSQTETDKAREIPINDVATKIFNDIKKKNKAVGPDVYVFYNKHGNPYSSISTCFKIVLKRTKIDDFRFHHLTHTLANGFVMYGGSQRKLQYFSCQPIMTMRYADLSKKPHRNMEDFLGISFSLFAP
jgi:integrase